MTLSAVPLLCTGASAWTPVQVGALVTAPVRRHPPAFPPAVVAVSTAAVVVREARLADH